jgi:hypothetical protein
MISYGQARQLLRRTALSAAMLLIATPAALADPPGYLFQDFDGTAPATVSAPIPPQRNAANQEAARLASARAIADVAEGRRGRRRSTMRARSLRVGFRRPCRPIADGEIGGHSKKVAGS